MRRLLFIVVALSVLWVSSAPPPPLSFINTTTISELKDVILTITTESAIVDNNQKSTESSTILDEELKISDLSKEESSQESFLSESEKSNESIIVRENTDGITISASVKEEAPFSSSSDDSKLIPDTTKAEISNSEVIFSTTELPVSKETDVINNKNEIPVLRYVPPLDPMKHMLMMADVKSIPRMPILDAKVNIIPSPDVSEITTVSTPTTEDILQTETRSTENIDSIEKVIPESSEVAEKRESILIDSTIAQSEGSSVTQSSEVVSSTNALNSDVSDDVSSTENLSTIKDLIEETTTVPTDIKENVENEKLALLKNSELALETEVSEEKIEETKRDNEATTAIFSTTEETIKVDVTKVDNLSTSSRETNSPALYAESETETEKFISTTENEIEEKLSETSSVTPGQKIISTTSTTSIPETTFEYSSRNTLVAENEKPEILPISGKESTEELEESNKNTSFEEELEFRAVKLPLNFSKVVYAEKAPTDVVDPPVHENSPQPEEKIETTTSNILTTIAELLFSSSLSTKVEETTINETEEESVTSTEEPKISNSPFSVEADELLETLSDSGAVLVNDTADILKVQLTKTGLNSVSSHETSTDILSEETYTESLPKELFEAQTIKPAEIELQNETLSFASDDETTAKYETETTVRAETTTKLAPESTTKTETTSVSFSSFEDTTTTKSYTVTEPEAESETEISVDVETLGNEPEVESGPVLESKPSDYLLNIKDRYVSGENKDMIAAVQFLHYHDKASSEQCFKLVDAHWNYATNLTEENKIKQLEQTLEYSIFHKEAWKNATSFAWKSFNDTLLRRWFKSLSVLGTAALPEEKLNEFNKLKAEMKNAYSTAKICPYFSAQSEKRNQIITEKDCNLTLEPDLHRILTKSRDYDELIHVWKAWRDAAGKPIREKYLRFVNLSNEAAHMNGFSDTGDMWREAYESETFETDLEELWEQLRPLYENLHAYVRRRLINQYGSDKIKENGPIPAHLFGNMWAQSWVSLLDITQPFPGKPSVDVTPIMEGKNMTAFEMFKISEEFFTSLDLKAMPEEFWAHSLIEKPKDREIICHASAWDFCNGKDYRIKQCTDITMEDLITVHHEMGHIQYFLQYARQPNVFREGANPGFHEAIGDVLALSVSTPKHLQSIGLLDEVADDPEGDLNFLLYTALDKVSFLPSGYLIDLWRWGLFSGEIKPEEMNSKWWELRLKYQGICPPVKRTDSDFDPGAKFHVPGNVPYIRYFVSFVIQFQFHKVLCDAAGHTGPLYKCDIYRSKEAGQILSQVMELGSSEHWSEAMKIMTGGATNKMDAGPILEYFEPLLAFLEQRNRNETLGWRSDDATICP